MNLTIRFRDSLVSILCLFLCAAVLAQGSTGRDSIEEILVTSEKSLSAMKAEMVAAENEVFNLFNEIYSDTDYEIICRREYIAYSRRSGRSCDTRFVRDREEEALEDLMLDLGAGGTEDDPLGLSGGLSAENFLAVEQHVDELDEKMEELYNADPGFRQNFNELHALKTTYEAALEADRERGFWSQLLGSSD